MAEQERLIALRNRLVHAVKIKETELKELHHKLAAIDEVYGLFLEESGGKREPIMDRSEKEKYKDVGLQDAILDCINNTDAGPAGHWTRPEIIDWIINHGLKTRSKKARIFYSVVSITLARLVNQNKILEDKGKKGKVFKKIDVSGIEGAVSTGSVKQVA